MHVLRHSRRRLASVHLHLDDGIRDAGRQSSSAKNSGSSIAPIRSAGTVEGPVLEPAYESFIGLYPIAMRHGMTVGELAGLFNDRFAIGAKLRVVRMTGWRHSMIWPDTGLQWVATSPNIPDWQTTFVYPGTGLLDSAGINNGSGYTKPFFLAGAPSLDGTSSRSDATPAIFPASGFVQPPGRRTSGFWKGRELVGVELMVFDPRRFAAVRCAVEILVAIRDLFPHESRSRASPGSIAIGEPIRLAESARRKKRERYP